MRQINNINVLGVGVEGREVVTRLASEFLLTDVYYLHYSELKSSDEFYIPFPGTVNYIYVKKDDIFEVYKMDGINLNKNNNIFHTETFIILILSDSISKY